MKVLDFNEFCQFCLKKSNKLMNTYFGKEKYRACSICRKGIQENDNEFFIQRRKEIQKEKAQNKARWKTYAKRRRQRKRKANPYTDKKNCKTCKIWINKSSWKNHNVSKKHAKNLFKEMSLA